VNELSECYIEYPKAKYSKFFLSGLIPTTNIVVTDNPTTSAPASDWTSIFDHFVRQESFNEAQKFCHDTLNGDLVRMIELNLSANATSPTLTGWIGLALSNSSFRWYSNETALEILKCFPRPNTKEDHCAFFECMQSQSSGTLPLTCIDPNCKCTAVTAEFLACVKGNNLALAFSEYALIMPR
jgi:hypothetical protein